nr:TolC family protein [Acidobacteriota bacterium]
GSNTASTLPLPEAIELAIRAYPGTAAARARRQSAEARVAEARLMGAPDVLVGAAYTDGFPGSGSHLGLRGMLGSPFVRHYVAGVDASWDLADLLRASPTRAAARAARDSETALEASARRDVALQIIALYERTLAAADAREILLAEGDARRDQRDAVKARVDAGLTAPEELTQADAALTDLDAELMGVQSDERAARAALRQWIADDRALTTTLVLVSPGLFGETPELRASLALRRQAAALLKLRTLHAVPRVMLGASAGYANPPPGMAAGVYAVSAGIVLPVTGLFRDRARRTAEAASVEARAHELDAVTQQIAIRAAELDAAIDGLTAALPAAERATAAAAASLDAVAARATAGLIRHADVEVARAALRKAQLRESILRRQINGMRARMSVVGGERPAKE